ncbi:MAG: NAD(P)/FAD-dependent oxidoreductase [Nitrososphaerales archaeon]
MENIEYLIIGGGLSGGYAAAAIRKRDTKGRVALITDEAHIPYDRVPLSKGYLEDKIKEESLFFKKQQFYDGNKIELFTDHQVIKLDAKNRQVELGDGRMISFGRLLLATGGRPRKIAVPGSDLDRIYYLRTIEDCLQLKEAASKFRSVAIIGGGFIGCELAAAFRSKGLNPTIIEMGPYLLNMAIDEESGKWLGEYLAERGVKVLVNSTAARFMNENDKVTGIETKSGESVKADFVVVGVGIAPNTKLAEDAGLKVDRGILTNEFLETSVEGIYAAGDAARFYSLLFERHLRLEHYDVAVKHGNIAGANMAGAREAYLELPYFFSYQFDLKINAYGDLSHRTRIVKRGSLSDKEGFFQFYFNEDRIDAVLSVNRGFDEIKKARELVTRRIRFPEPSEISDESKTLESWLTNS